MVPVTDELLDETVRAIVTEVDPEQVILSGARARALREGRVLYERPYTSGR